MHTLLRCRVPAAAAILFLTGAPGALRGEPLVPTHPAIPLAQEYLQAVVSEDWEACARRLLPAALARKQHEAVGEIKSSATVSEEATRLSNFGLSSIAELEHLTPQQFYVIERRRNFRSKIRTPDDPEKQARKLQMEILATASEDQGRLVHVLIRTITETSQLRLRELILVSLLQSAADSRQWFVVPDSLLPIAEPLPRAAKPSRQPSK